MVAFRILPAAADFPRQAFMSPHIGEREKKKKNQSFVLFHVMLHYNPTGISF